jgi:four helix bundle protein
MSAELKARTKRSALAVLALAVKPAADRAGEHICGQSMRAGTSVGANYRAACRSQSKADFIAKMATVEEEADESAYWLEVLAESGRLPQKKVGPLLDEANQLTAIAVASIRTARGGSRPG